jgi:hypothetical protein
VVALLGLSIKLPFKKYPRPNGGFDQFAVVSINISLPGKNAPRSKRFEAIIDSGACRCTFHSGIGKAIGLEVDKGEVEETYGVSGEPTTVHLHDIHLHAPGGIIPIRAAFTEKLPVAAILGMDGFFNHFRVTFDPTAQRCELERIYQA